MPVYYFHLRHRGEFIRDWYGKDLDCFHSAQENARSLAALLARIAGRSAQFSTIEMVDHAGQKLAVFRPE